MRSFERILIAVVCRYGDGCLGRVPAMAQHQRQHHEYVRPSIAQLRRHLAGDRDPSEFSKRHGLLDADAKWRQCGQASLVVWRSEIPLRLIPSYQRHPVVTITEPYMSETVALLFIAHANNGHIGQGIRR